MGRILLTGANGSLGRQLLRRLAADTPAGAGVRAVVRSERAAAVLRGLPASIQPEITLVDYADAEKLAEAARGCDAAVHLIGILKETATARYTEAHETTTSALLRAARRAGVGRVVYLSILGARPDARNACLASKGRAEQLLLESDIPAVVLRVPMVLCPGDYATQALRRRARAGVVALVRGGATLEQPIDAADVVEAIVRALMRPVPASLALDLAGPESLSHRDLLLRVARLHGRRPRILPVPSALARLGAGVLQRLLANPPLTPAMLGVLEQDDRIDPAPACAALGIELTPLDTTLRRLTGPEPA